MTRGCFCESPKARREKEKREREKRSQFTGVEAAAAVASRKWDQHEGLKEDTTRKEG